MSGFLGCGELFVDRKVDGVWQGFKSIGNATKFELKANSELKQRISKSCDTYGQPIDSVTIQRPAEVNVTLDDLNRDNLAIIFLGDSTASVITGGTVTDELIPVVTLDSMVRTASGNINTLVVSEATGVTPYTLGSDYEVVNAKVGLIKILATGTITAGADISVDYVSDQIDSNLVTGGTNPDVKLRYLLVGRNLATQTPVQVDVWESNASPQSGVDFLSEDFTSIEMSGTANIDPVRGNPYEVNTDIVNA